MEFTLEEWKVDTNRCLLERAGVEHRVEYNVMQLLEFLARNHGRALSREELVEGAWDGRHVAPGTLTAAVSVLRKKLGDTPGRPVFIQTIPRHGYRLLARPIETRAEPFRPVLPRARRSRIAQRWPIAFAVAVAILGTWARIALHHGF